MLSSTYVNIGSPTGPTTYWSKVVEVCAQRDVEDSAIRLSADVLPQGRYTERASSGTRKPRTPKAAVATVVEVMDSDEIYTRPNGTAYHSRTWGEHGDVAVLRKAREETSKALSGAGGSPMFVLAYGAPGCGKTALMEAAFGAEMITLIGTGDTEVADLEGSYVQTPSGGFEWVDGGLIRAIENGYVYFIDEVGLIDPKVLSAVYGIMDGRREYNLTANPDRGTIKVHPDFYVVAATNPNAPGVRLSEALLSRFTLQVEMTTDWNLARKLGVSTTVVTAAQNLAKKQQSGEVSWAPQMRELLAFRDIAESFGTTFAIENLLAAAPEMDRPVVADVLTRAFGAECKPAKI